MAFPEFQTKEVLNKVLNTGKDALKVDIDNVTLDGSQLSVDIDKENDSIVIFSNTAADGSGTNTVPLVDAAGHTQVDIVSSALPSGGATAANQATIIGHVDGLETLLTGIDADTDAIKTDAAAIEVLLTAANVDHAANEALLITIDEDTNAIKGHVDGIETLITSTNSKIDTFDAVLDNILTKNTEIDAVLDTIKTDTGTIDSDTNDIKTATESSNTHLGNMFYDTALAVTPSDGSDLTGEPFFALFVGVGGDVKVDMASGTGTVVLKNCASGQILPLMVERVYSTDTTATDIIAFK